jgi:tRNA A-37 threonylcarbamoyl transferase component Bud32
MVFVDSLGDLAQQQLREARQELERRLRAGESCSAEELLRRYPNLSSSADLALELIFTEFVTRKELGEPVDVAAWYGRFPDWRDRLERLLGMYQLIDKPDNATESGPNTLPLVQARGPTASPKGFPRAFDRYELLGLVDDQGAMGVVYKARQHPPLERLVALKTLRLDGLLRPEARQRFAQEAQAAGRLRHPNIIAVYDVGEHDGQHYLTMPFVAGGSLAQHLKRFQQDPRAAVQLVEKIARAVHHAHENDILHRDLKPGNILLDERDEPLVADFGLAKFLDTDVNLTETGGVVGTPAYLSPEQAAGHSNLTPASDVWALGVILYELLTGRRPFVKKEHWDLRDLILRGDPPRPRSLCRGFDRSLETVVLKCLAKEPARRYDSAGALADDLARWLRGEPTLARPVSCFARAWRRRGVRRVFAGVVLVMMAVSGALLVSWLMAPDPDRPIKKIEAGLAQKEAQTLIGATGPPSWWRWRTGAETSQVSAAWDGTFSIHSWGLAMVDLVRDPQTSHYRIQAQVRHEKSDELGEVGLFFSLEGYPAGEAVVCFFVQLSFNDIKDATKPIDFGVQLPQQPPVPKGNSVNLVPRLFAEGKPSPAWDTIVPGRSAPLFKAAGFGGGPWRSLTVVVTPHVVRAFWETKERVGEIPARELEGNTKAFLDMLRKGPRGASLSNLHPVFNPRGSLGLYAYKSSASFRGFVVEPINEGP